MPSKFFEELDFEQTPIGDVSLRRRIDPRVGDEAIYEVLLNDEFLMSSLFTASERALASLPIAALKRDQLDVVVGGLGLGHTAWAALNHSEVRGVLVIELLPPVIRWHRQGLVPNGEALAAEPRCRLTQGDFFALAESEQGFDHAEPARQFDLILLDIDHTPEHFLHGASADFYSPTGLRALCRHLKPHGCFAMWSNAPPQAAFNDLLKTSFASVEAEVVRFDNPYQSEDAACTVYIALR